MISTVSQAQAAPRWLLPTALGLGALTVLTRLVTRAGIADDYDSFGFLLGMDGHFDLTRFQPQFPGYPVYVALGAGLRHLGLSALGAATALSAVASGVSGLALAFCARRLCGAAAVVPVLVLQLLAWLPWLLGSGVLSESLGVALIATAFALLAARQPRVLASGLVTGLALGVRASYWPFGISLALLAGALRPRAKSVPTSATATATPVAFDPTGAATDASAATGTLAQRHEPARLPSARFGLGFGAGVALWALPFTARVGLGELWRLGTVHLAGHFEQWGGSVVTRPQLGQRLAAFGFDLVVEGLAPNGWALLAIAGALGARLTYARRQGRATGLAALPRPALVAALPYAIWAFLAQNIVEQPRHLLPLVEILVLALGCACAAQPVALGVVALALACVSAPLAWTRRHTPPAAAQAGAWLAAHAVPSDTLAFGTRSPRFFRALAPDVPVRETPWLSEAIHVLSRLDRLPPTVYLTSEVDPHSGLGERSPLPRHWRLVPRATFCRDARIDHFHPCLTLSTLELAP